MKEFLSNQDPFVTDLLPEGAIKQLAQEFSLNKDVVSRMLRGQYGREEKLEAIFKRAVQLIEEKGKEHLSAADTLRQSLPLLEKSSV